MKIPATKQALIKDAEVQVEKYEKVFRRGLISDEERYEKVDRKSTRLNSSHITRSRMPSSA